MSKKAMPMTQDSFPHSLQGKVIEWGKIGGALAAMAGAVVLFFGWLFYARDWIELQEAESLRLDKLVQAYDNLQVQVTELTDTQKAQTEALATLANNVDVATRPRMIFEVNTAQSGPRDGSCTEYMACTIDLRVRRTPDGLLCAIVPNSERYFFQETATGARIQVNMISGTPSTNIGREWFDYHRTFEMPADFDEPITFSYQATYTKCRGETDNVEITQESPPIAVRLVNAENTP